MTETTRPARPWLAELQAIQRQMADVPEDEVLAALQVNEADDTVGALTVARHEGRGDQAETCSAATAFQQTCRVRGSEQPERSGSASTPTS